MSLQAEVIAVADVRDHGHVALVEAQARAEDAAARRFKHGRVDVRVHQHAAGAAGAGAVVVIDAAVVEVDPVGAGHARRGARCL